MNAFNDSPFLFVAAEDRLIAERRFDRPYDEQSPATLLHPNGSAVCSSDRAFVGAALAVMYAAWRKQMGLAA